MKNISRRAIVSAVIAWIALWCAVGGEGGTVLLGIPLGLAAVIVGGSALRGLRAPRPGAPTGGRGAAISAVLVGLLAAFWTMAVILRFVLLPFSPGGGPRQNWDRNGQIAALEWNSAMPGKGATDFTSNLPIIVVDTEGQHIPRESGVTLRARFYDTAQGRASLKAQPAYDGLISIHRRGYSTQHLPKSSFTLHTVEKDGKQVKVPLLGLPAEEDWVLYAPFEDKTMMRDVLAYELARKMGHYAPRTRYVELFLRTANAPLSMRQYAGVYVLVEKIKRGKDRVNISKLRPEDKAEPEISGGYIVKRDHSDQSGSRFRTRRSGPYSYVYPKPEKITAQQKRWIKDYLNSLEAALYGPGFADSKTGYAAYLDVGSFIDAHWLIEMSKNVDGFRYSAFLSKDREGKIKMEPIWDWNRAFGNANYYDGGQTRGWYWPRLRSDEISWYNRLQKDPQFSRQSAERWRELRKDVFDPKKINQRIDELAAQLEEAQQRNFRRWPILGRQITCNYYVGDSYQDEVRWLKKWIERRIAWIDGQVAKTEGY